MSVVVEAKLVGMDKVRADFEKRARAVANRVDAAVAGIASKGAQRMRDAMLAQPSPSPIGGAPAVVTGRLIKSISTEHRAQSMEARIRVRDPKWHLLEFGTKKMSPRPFFRNNAEAAARAGEADIIEAVKENG